eukprot:CAMPEP_0172832058 /NCGR_PEP_ID=MMETSP1075-20121228/23405_1 /TAXON_ID=2916 /ORGANISM="Ceratium fusus, Strain PA161109" /LENGTH=89 /DNA_ID=CAMNT_0013674609 /DNA_START=856 /DNA_END=1126 /DNA_ORIENTATION=+
MTSRSACNTGLMLSTMAPHPDSSASIANFLSARNSSDACLKSYPFDVPQQEQPHDRFEVTQAHQPGSGDPANPTRFAATPPVACPFEEE